MVDFYLSLQMKVFTDSYSLIFLTKPSCLIEENIVSSNYFFHTLFSDCWCIQRRIWFSGISHGMNSEPLLVFCCWKLVCSYFWKLTVLLSFELLCTTWTQLNTVWLVSNVAAASVKLGSLYCVLSCAFADITSNLAGASTAALWLIAYLLLV